MHGSEKFSRLVEIMNRLRAPDGCPWDRQQTHASLRQYLLEEAYEVLEAIDAGEDEELCNELGDLLLQVVYHAQIAAETGRFDIGEVIDGICEKMIRRHPHVFGDAKVDSAEEQTQLWEKLKQQEGKKSAIDGVPRALPALQKAARLQQKTNAAAAEHQNVHQQLIDFSNITLNHQNGDRMHHHESLQTAFGDLLFNLVSLGRGLGLNAEDALREACERFTHGCERENNHN